MNFEFFSLAQLLNPICKKKGFNGINSNYRIILTDLIRRCLCLHDYFLFHIQGQEKQQCKTNTDQYSGNFGTSGYTATACLHTISHACE